MHAARPTIILDDRERTRYRSLEILGSVGTETLQKGDA